MISAAGMYDNAMLFAVASFAVSLLMAGMFNSAVVAMIASFATSVLIVMTQEWHGKHSLDKDMNGIQKFHKKPVPRIGGVALFVGGLVALIVSAFDYSNLTERANSVLLFKFLLAGLPAFLAGLIEDLTKKVSVRARLFATFASALLAGWIFDAYLPRLDTWGLDDLLQWAPMTVMVTAIAVAGVANSINIIDGFHGVAGSAVVIILAGLGLLSLQVGDIFISRLAFLGIGITLGFLLVNYPSGRLFMGDGGAYFLGFWLAEVAVLLVARHPVINAWQVLAICAYPVIEVLYSIYRRKVIRKMSPGDPDRLHLHTLIYRRVICQWIPRNDSLPWIRNAAVACVLGTWIAMTTLIAMWVGTTIPAAVTVLIAEVLLYIAVYRRLVYGRWNLNPMTLLWPRSQAALRELS